VPGDAVTELPTSDPLADYSMSELSKASGISVPRLLRMAQQGELTLSALASAFPFKVRQNGFVLLGGWSVRADYTTFVSSGVFDPVMGQHWKPLPTELVAIDRWVGGIGGAEHGGTSVLALRARSSWHPSLARNKELIVERNKKEDEDQGREYRPTDAPTFGELTPSPPATIALAQIWVWYEDAVAAGLVPSRPVEAERKPSGGEASGPTDGEWDFSKPIRMSLLDGERNTRPKKHPTEGH
ncbi:MAG: hypothetical protein ACI9MR_000383, partial [Myxococcota bacterium]